MFLKFILIASFYILYVNCIDNNVVQTIGTNKIEQGQERKINKILNLLNSLTKDVKKIKNQLKSFKENEKTTKHECKHDPTKNYIIQNCGNNTFNTGQHYIVDGDYGTYSSHGFCRVIIPTLVNTNDGYQISVWLYNTIGPRGINSGHLGLAFNVKDEFNFDFVYLRLHHPQNCLRSGFYQNGKVIWFGQNTRTCIVAPPKGRKWFKLELSVFKSSATINLDGVQLTNLVPHFKLTGRGGVIVAAGHQNVIKFKHYYITAIDRSQFQISKCNSYNKIGTNYYLIQASVVKWPASGFCSAISKQALDLKDYMLSVSLFNQASIRDRNAFMGIAYNVRDKHNYDFVYFRPNSLGGCYTTGYLQNSQLRWSNSKVGECAGGKLRHAAWYNITVYVSDSQVSITVGGTHVTSTLSHYKPIGRGGVITGNGDKNTVAFRDYQLVPYTPLPFLFRNCGSDTKFVNEYYVLDGEHGQWPESTFCKAISKVAFPGKYYNVTASLFMQSASAGSETDYAGIMFNVQNENNYDFIFLMPHDYKSCFKVGYVFNGEIQWSSILEGNCFTSKLKVVEWVKLAITVNDQDAMISLNGKHLIMFQPHYPAVGASGVISGNGYRNMLSFRGFKVTSIQPLPFTFYQCAAETHIINQTVYIDGSQKRGSVMTFCRAVSIDYPDAYRKNSYRIQASFYNINSWQGADWGRFGIMYNLKDEENYEFIIINLQLEGGECFQYGSVYNNIPTFNRDYSGICKIKIPAYKWLDISISIGKNKKVLVKINNQDITTLNSISPYIPRGGVLVPNGNKNIVMFKNFTIL